MTIANAKRRLGSPHQVGTHADMPDLEVTESEAMELASQKHWCFVALPNTTGTNPITTWLDLYIDTADRE